MATRKRSSSAARRPSNQHDTLSQLGLGELLTLVWFCIDAFTHLTIELGYVHLALTSTAAKGGNSIMAKIWREYGKADRRWAERDVGIISVEIATVFVGVLCLVQVWALLKKKPWRHCLQLLISVAEIYGGWMTFAPEWFSVPPNPSLNGSTVELFWIFLVFMNGLWVVVPLILCWDSWSKMTFAVANQESRLESAPAKPSDTVWIGMASLLVLYMVLVPLILFKNINFFV